ncbi:hypothetical protein [Streptomyces sp. NPDC050485]|uniref:hypothetical protein n=1 Tax=Streptomyces sp. NPDC050485 TaxID=3365617 RepID=UPI00379AB2A7
MASDPSPTQGDHNSIGTGDDPRYVLLRTVAASRPMHEVVSLVHLLNRAGEYPRPGDQALRLAAVARSVDEVHQLISLLNKPPNGAEDAQTILRAAATDRPIEDVAALIASFGPDGGEPFPTASPEEPTATEPSAPEWAEAEETRAPEPVAWAEEARAPEPVAVAEETRAPEPVAEAEGSRAPEPVAVAEEPRAPEPVAVAEEARVPEPVAVAEGARVPEPVAVAEGARAPEPVAGVKGVAGGLAGVLLPVRSVLRWPAAVVLLAIGAIHLPAHLMDLRTGHLAAGVSMIIAAACLTLACLLPLYDPLWAWMAGAAAAVGTVVIHSLVAGLNSVHLLRNSLGGTFTGATRLAVLCAVLAAVLAGTVLVRKLRPHMANEA